MSTATYADLVLRYTCQACCAGMHEMCAGKRPPPPGMLGGEECICEGGCKPRRSMEQIIEDAQGIEAKERADKADLKETIRALQIQRDEAVREVEELRDEIQDFSVDRSALSTVRGHLEGYADAIVLTETVDRAMLVKSLREDAAALAGFLEATAGG